jgi:hypothetical protein
LIVGVLRCHGNENLHTRRQRSDKAIANRGDDGVARLVQALTAFNRTATQTKRRKSYAQLVIGRLPVLMFAGVDGIGIA